MVRARDIDRLGVSGVIETLKKRAAGTKVYISVDIDVLDPAFAPGKFRSKHAIVSYAFSYVVQSTDARVMVRANITV
jgi:hypothetical protein